MTHSTVVGGSSVSRVINCPASVRLSKDIPQGPTSVYAEEGTALHALMESMLLNDAEPSEEMIGQKIGPVEITTDLYWDKVIPAWAATKEAFKRLSVEEYEPEAQVHFSSIDGAFGTCDIFARGRDNLVVILDYKFGHNVISPVDNQQLLFYAAAALEDGQFADWWTGDMEQPVMLGIIQPNPERETALWTWQTTVREIIAFTMQVSMAVTASHNDDLTPCTGDHCKYCPAAPVCPAKNSQAREALQLKADDKMLLEEGLAMMEELDGWFKQLKDMAHIQLEAGGEVSGYKLVKKRSSRVFVDTEIVRKKLAAPRSGLMKSDYIKETLVTAPQLEKICKAKGVDFKKYDEHIELVSSGTTMAKASDKREGITVKGNRKVPAGFGKA